MVGYTIVNIFVDRLLAIFNNISVAWHVLGVLVIIALVAFVPSHHQSASFVFGQRLNNTGFHGGLTSGAGFFLYILPLGFIMTMYTQTGYDASAHTAEETRGAAKAAAQGVWRSVFFSAIAGWALLLALLFAATHVNAINTAGGGAIPVVNTGLSAWAAKFVLIIFAVGQLFCGAAGLTSASRTWYAFSRDRGMPGWWLFRRLTAKRVPFNAVIAVSVFALIITIPAYWGNHAGLPVAFLAVTSISVIGLYIAYTIPIYLRYRQGEKFQHGPWTLGGKYKWINVIAILWVALCVIIFCLPFTPAAVPFSKNFSWSAFNYAPLVTIVVMAGVTIWYLVSAKKTFKGPVRTIDEPDVGAPTAAAPGVAPAAPTGS